MTDSISIEGPVELLDGNLILRIPLSVGGDKLAPLARGIGQIEGDYLCVIIKPWLADHLRIGAGSLVCVDNGNGKFRITRSAANDPEPPFLIVRKGQSFWVETRAVDDCSATLQAFHEGCFGDAWCYDSTGGAWPILEARLKQPPSFVHRVLPWKRVAVELHLGARVNADLPRLVSELATVLRSGNEFCESLPAPPAEILARFERARAPAEIIHIARTSRI